MGKGDRIGIMLDMNPGIIEIFSDGNDIPAKVQYAMSPLHQSLEEKKYMEN